MGHQYSEHPKRSCKLCNLCIEISNISHVDVFWVGLSGILNNDKEYESKCPMPLTSTSPSGALVDNAISKIGPQVRHLKTNLVKCAPSSNGKLRYPNKVEMASCYPMFEIQYYNMKPKIVFLLGLQVACFVLNKNGFKFERFDSNFQYKVYKVDESFFIPIHHPSYILIYRRGLVDEYLRAIISLVNSPTLQLR